MREIFIDTETTGLNHQNGDRIIEFGAVETVNRKVTNNNLHFYFNPGVEVTEGAFKIHGISNDFLKDKPRFEEKVQDIISYVKESRVIIHNAKFDTAFINLELSLLKEKNYQNIEYYCEIFDSLVMARKIHPGQKNSLDALCARYGVNNKHRKFHGALLDAELLAEVYLMMTGGQTNLFSDSDNFIDSMKVKKLNFLKKESNTKLLNLYNKNYSDHDDYLDFLDKKSDNKTLWRILSEK